jgi:dihydropteroate synthase
MKSAKYLAILNITPDSFSDGSQNFRDLGWLLDKAEKLMESGAYALDVGAESTRPDAEPVSAIEEYQRLENFLKVFCSKYDFPLSIDTRKYEVMEALLSEPFFREKISFLNDVEGFTDERKLELISKYDKEQKIKLIAMHSKGGVPPSLKALEVREDYYLSDYPQAKNEKAAFEMHLIDFFSRFLDSCENYGIDLARVILDPGLGFGKNYNHSYDLIEILPKLKNAENKIMRRSQGFNPEILIAASRKSFLSAALNAEKGVREQCENNGTLAERNVDLDLLTQRYNELCYEAGARYFRVHKCPSLNY